MALTVCYVHLKRRSAARLAWLLVWLGRGAPSRDVHGPAGSKSCHQLIQGSDMRHLVCREGVDLSLQVLADGGILNDVLIVFEATLLALLQGLERRLLAK
jgi:hypothetical protein